MQYQGILDEIVEKSKQILGEELIGIYLHGSLAMGCFNPDKSDIDLIVVIKDHITDIQKIQFMNCIVDVDKIAPSKGIELSIVKQRYCKYFIYPTPFELHFSNAHLQWFMKNSEDYIRKMNGEDKDLAAHFKVIKSHGIVLYGAEINDIFGDVPRADYIDSIWNDIGEAREDILEEPVYTILNLCRVEAFLKSDLVLSKKQGAEWAIKNLPSKYHTLISNAVKSYTGRENVDIDHREGQEFADYMIQMIKTMMS